MARLDMEERRDRIVALLSEHGRLSAAALSEGLAVSVQTIRADLRDLDHAGLVQRRSGTAQLRQQHENIGYLPRESIARQEKQRIALAVKALIPNGARVALGTGTTVEQCARLLAAREDLFVATNSIHAVCALQTAVGATVELAGGSVRMRDLDMIGVAALEFFARYRVDYAVFSCGGLSTCGDVMDYNTDEVSARKAIAACANQTILVVDSQKAALDLPCRHAALWDYDLIVTGATLPDDLRRACARAACRIVQV
ncbi:DeoR/GlpR family DNA-binding transcription regulator [Pseudosulfitobacter koreensis]|uniref:DeoR/GlpR family DNA-binding transcription regulator n=1 Tax=Pseudosulfitobacter koreensis TaxID=2968472 RepID=A0ABT1Z1F3_9RHOB|nr:DeoR/GlpR family DNA-binding transcription regulator [Pseudosulfitobacter koreense]MCR8826970.1 DeoR/GlpR family DNA-binding transcription regulator [Pseudosulfitobacter koreense]